MLNADFLEHISKHLNKVCKGQKPLTGGDINAVYLLESKSEKFVIKVNNAKRFPDMFKKEALGLKALKKPQCIDVPEVIIIGTFENKSYLVQEYRPTGSKTTDFWSVFGHKLAKLHQESASQFGFAEDNYIGSLPQYNTAEDNAVDFYINQRLRPQFELAEKNGYKFTKIDLFYDKIRQYIPDEPPALIHGDLWGGNYLVNANGEPCLIDPATAFAPREMDIGMMHLFGGFDPALFKAYNEEFPLAEGWQNRIKLWQLYYILVHVNLFGGSYYASAKAIMQQYHDS